MDVEGASADGRDEDAGQCGQSPTEGPREGGQPLGPAAVELQQGGIVDHGAHGHTRPGAREEQPDADGDEDAAAEGDGLVVRDIDTEELELGCIAEEQAVGAGHARVPDPLGQGDEPQHDADGHHNFGDVGRLA